MSLPFPATFPHDAGLRGAFVGDPQKRDVSASVFPTRAVGVALAVGGVRAALYSLGALIYLVNSGHCVYDTEISSVSGGSITNAFIAQ